MIASGGDLQSAAIGALTGGMLGYIGSNFSGVGKTVAHGFVGGVQSRLSGGKFNSGFLAGAFGQFAGGGNIIQRVVVGGTASVIGGGKFANGAFTGAFGYMFGEMPRGSHQRIPTFQEGKGGVAFVGGFADKIMYGLKIGGPVLQAYKAEQ